MSPLRLLVVSTVAVAGAELAAIRLIDPLTELQGAQHFVLELALMMLLVFPILYVFTFRPMLRQISERRQAEAALKRLSADLDSRITARTAELAAVNKTLMGTVAERLAAESELEAERSFITAVLDTAGALVVVLDRAGRIVRFNRSCERTTGYSFEEVRGRAFWDFLIPADEISGVEAAFAKLTAGQFPLDHENRWLARDRTTRLISWTNMALLDAQGEVEFVIGTGIDVTERHRVEELAQQRALEAVEARADAERRADELDTVFNAINDAVMVFDATGRVVRANPAAIAAIGSDPTNTDLGSLLSQVTVVGPEGRPSQLTELASYRALRGEAVKGVRQVVTSADGREYTVMVSGAPLRAAGRIAGAVVVLHDITDSTRVEGALGVVLEKYRVLFESFPLGITISDRSGQIVEVNREAKRLLGMPEPDLLRRQIGDPRWEIIRPDGSPMPPDELAGVRALKEKHLVENVEMGLRGANGTITWINVTAAPIPLATYGVAITYGDITARKQAEHALQASESKLRSLYASMTEGLALHELVHDAQGRPVDYLIVDVNPAFQSITGLQRDQVVGRLGSAAYGTGDAPYLDIYARVAESGEPISFEVFFPPMDRHFAISVFSPERGTFATVFDDITQRRRAEHELRETRDYLEKLFTYANAPIIVWDPEFRITRFNAAFERLTGLTAADVRGAHLDLLFPPGRREEALAHIRRAGAGERWEVLEIPIQGVSGEVRTVLWNSATLFADDGRTVVATIAQGQDITERKQAEELNRASLREKELLLKEIHHRVKNNLQIIASLLNLQADQLPDDRGIDILTESQNRIRSMALVHEKLYRAESFSRILFGDYVEDLASYLVRSYRLGTGEITLRLAAAEVFLGIDLAVPIALIVNELITNSIKHAFPGGRGGTIAIELTRPATGGYRFVVADDGIGFPVDLDFRSTRSLGLQIVCILVDQVGGTIELERTVGTRFTITFGEPAEGGSK
ncbi:MAG: PAS domain S-box protein [Thermoanaerobaculaceae bacterium]|jgi:PAS domain S-box-containing protein|nr:PAS domain S-box protein [Thermoanaerobaculaceae bacterium]